MMDIDQTIRDALSAEDARWFDEMDELSMPERLIGVFQGKSKWFAAMGFALTVACLVLSLCAAYQFFRADTTREMIAWATAFLFCGTSIAMLKIWYWLEMSKNSVTREIKRFELQLARLAGRLPD